MIDVTNSGFGLLRVLSADIWGFLVATIVIVVVATIVNRVIGGPASAPMSAGNVLAKRATRRIAFGLWVLMLAVTLAHAASVIVSLRIPRSDVVGTDVYRQMDVLTQGTNR